MFKFCLGSIGGEKRLPLYDSVGVQVDSESSRFVVISGLPGSGKSSLAQRLSAPLALPVIDKDDILEALFEAKGVGDDAWRRALSRESDLILRGRAEASSGAILVSFWRLPGMGEGSGTPTDWLADLVGRRLHLRCLCPVEIAAARFNRRQRHPGHRDRSRSFEEILENIRSVARLGSLELEPRIDVDTSGGLDLENLVGQIR